MPLTGGTCEGSSGQRLALVFFPGEGRETGLGATGLRGGAWKEGEGEGRGGEGKRGGGAER